MRADLVKRIEVLQAEDVAEAVAFVASVPRHVNVAAVTILPTEQVI